MSDAEPTPEVLSTNGKTTPSPTMTFQKAVEMGEYKPEYLSTFPEWHTLSKHTQWQFVRDALANRERQLIQQWAEIVNVLDFRLKPHLNEALKNIQAQQKTVQSDKEELLLEFSTL